MGQRTQIFLAKEFINKNGVSQHFNEVHHLQWGFATTMPKLLVGLVTGFCYGSPRPFVSDYSEYLPLYTFCASASYQLFKDPTDGYCDNPKLLWQVTDEALTENLFNEVAGWCDNDDGFMVIKLKHDDRLPSYEAQKIAFTIVNNGFNITAETYIKTWKEFNPDSIVSDWFKSSCEIFGIEEMTSIEEVLDT